MKIIRNLAAIGILFSSASAYTSTLPTPEEVQGIINACGAGRSVEVVGELNLSFEKLFAGKVEGEGKLSDLAGIIANIKDDKLKVEVYQLYLSCLVPSLSKASPQKKISGEGSQTTTGDKSPIINNTDGPVSISY